MITKTIVIVCGGISTSTKKASFDNQTTNRRIFGSLAIVHLEDKLSGTERAWSARSKPHDLMQENSVIFHNGATAEGF